MEVIDLKAPEPVLARQPDPGAWHATVRDYAQLQLDLAPRAGNIFAATGTPFDWGDAALAHPFASLWVILRTAAGPHTPGLAETYLQPWLEAGHPRPAVDRALLLALRIAPMARALTWGRLFPCYLGHPGPAGHAAHALAAILEPQQPGGGELA